VSVWNVLILAIAVLAVVEAISLVAIMRQVGRLTLQGGAAGMTMRSGGPEIGTIVSLPAVPLSPETLVLFLSSGCAPCESLAADIGQFTAEFPHVRILAALHADDRSMRERIQDSLGASATPELETLFRDWQIPGTPFVVGLNDDGRVRVTGAVNTREQLEVILAATAEPLDAHERRVPVSAAGNGGAHAG
jgi:thiol-disulfide isomerase/thioredoxin